MPPQVGGASGSTTTEAAGAAAGDTFMKGAGLFALGGVLGGATVGAASLFSGAGNMSRGAFTREQGIAVLAGAAVVGAIFLVAGMNSDA